MRSLLLKQPYAQSATGSGSAQSIKVGPESFAYAPTKRIDVVFFFLAANTTTGFTFANIMTQMGGSAANFLLDTGLPIKKVVDFVNIQDLVMLLWQYFGEPPPNVQGGTTNNTVNSLTLPIWFGLPWRDNEGLPPTNLNFSWSIPANANEIDGAIVSLVQYIEPGAVYNKTLVYSSKDGPTPSTTLRKDFPFPLHDLDQEVLIDLIFQTTGSRTTTATTTIEDYYLMKDGSVFGDKIDVEHIMMQYKPHLGNICGVSPQTTIDDYIALDWRKILGRLFIPRRADVQAQYGINFLGGDTNAVRDAQLAYVPL